MATRPEQIFALFLFHAINNHLWSVHNMHEASEVVWILQSREDRVTVHKEVGL